MKTVNVSKLKAHLSAYLQTAQRGEEVLVCDREHPVARIVPCDLADHVTQQQRLVARGILAPPRKQRPLSTSWPTPPGNIPDKVMKQVWRRERQGR
jgi:prevent-host-death family protein